MKVVTEGDLPILYVYIFTSSTTRIAAVVEAVDLTDAKHKLLEGKISSMLFSEAIRQFPDGTLFCMDVT